LKERIMARKEEEGKKKMG